MKSVQHFGPIIRGFDLIHTISISHYREHLETFLFKYPEVTIENTADLSLLSP